MCKTIIRSRSGGRDCATKMTKTCGPSNPHIFLTFTAQSRAPDPTPDTIIAQFQYFCIMRSGERSSPPWGWTTTSAKGRGHHPALACRASNSSRGFPRGVRFDEPHELWPPIALSACWPCLCCGCRGVPRSPKLFILSNRTKNHRLLRSRWPPPIGTKPPTFFYWFPDRRGPFRLQKWTIFYPIA